MVIVHCVEILGDVCLTSVLINKVSVLYLLQRLVQYTRLIFGDLGSQLVVGYSVDTLGNLSKGAFSQKGLNLVT